MKSKIQNLSPQEVLQLAISIERSNYLSLKTFSQFFEGQNELDIALRFTEMANEELEHEAILKRRYVEMFGEYQPEAVNVDLDGPERELMLNVFKGKDAAFFDRARKVYELALIGENRAREFYQEAATLAGQEPLKLLFNQLAVMEDNHGAWLEKKLSQGE